MQHVVYICYWLLFFKNDNLKCTAICQRCFNSFSLFYIFISFYFHAQRNMTSIIYIAYFELLLCNVLHTFRNMYLWKSRKGLFFFASPNKFYLLYLKNFWFNVSDCYVSSIKPIPTDVFWSRNGWQGVGVKLPQQPYFFLDSDRKLLLIDVKHDTHAI